jgi:predicted nucleic acid-binding protein
MPLCDTLLRLAEEPGLYRPLWSEEILQEVSRALEQLGYSQKQRDRRLQAMQTAFPEATIAVPEELEGKLGGLPDEKDCHVLAVAIMAKTNVIVTLNTKHFPAECLGKYGILCHTPDDFLVHQYYLAPQRVLDQLDYQASNIKQERGSLVEALGKAVPRFAKLVITGKID